MSKIFKKIGWGFINFFKHPGASIRNFIWIVRIIYQNVKETLIDLFKIIYSVTLKPLFNGIKFVSLNIASFFKKIYIVIIKTKVGGFIHKYCFRYIYKYFLRYIGLAVNKVFTTIFNKIS